MTPNMEFNCRLAHQDGPTKRLTNFNSIKELYNKVSSSFSVPTDEILYCTLNTLNFRDMNSLLGNYLSSGDLIVVHLRGQARDLSIRKTQEYLGLTITDNGNGRAFVKKVASEDADVERLVQPGDHIAAINAESTVGWRHYQVAKAIRDVPLNTQFTIKLIEPLHSKDIMASKDLICKSSTEQSSGQNVPLFNATINDSNQKVPGDTHMDSSFDSLINSSLPIDRLLSKGALGKPNATDAEDSPIDNESSNIYKLTIDKINSTLESFLGINDNLLAIQIYRTARENKDDYDQFVAAVKNSELSAFNFSEDIKSHLWRCATGIMMQH